MHIVFPIGSFYPAQSGGPSNSVYWLAKALVRSGHRVTVLSTTLDLPPNVPRNRWLDTDYGRVIYVSTTSINLPLSLYNKAQAALREADVLHLTSLFFPLSYALGMSALKNGQPLVWSPRGELAPAALAHKTTAKQLMLSSIRGKSDLACFHATSSAEADDVRRTFGRASWLAEIPNYLELPERQPRQPSRYLLFLGRLHPIKAIDRLLEAVALSDAFRKSDFVLKFVGDGEPDYVRHLRGLAAQLLPPGRVRWEGAVLGDAKQRLLADAHLTLLPSHTENFGNVVIESLAQETPVLASTGTPWSALKAERIGGWVNNAPADLAAEIDRLLTLPLAEYAAYRRRAGQFVRTHYDVHANVGVWEETYRRVIARNFEPVCAVSPAS